MTWQNKLQVMANPYLKKVVENLFKDKESITRNEVREIMKEYFNPDKVSAYDVSAFDTKFTWGEILRTFETKENITDDEFVDILKYNDPIFKNNIRNPNI